MTRSPAGHADAQIVDLIRKGSVDEGIRVLLEQYGPKVHGVLKGRFGSVHDQDIQQAIHDAALRLWRQPDRFNPTRGSLAGWFLTSATNNTINLIRAQAAHPLLELGEADLPGRDPATRSEQMERKLEVLRECIGMLSEHQQHIILSGLADQHDNDAELAEQLATTVSAIGTARHKAMKRLGTLMERELP
jgi:RNA polymerase sigma factor (sigma-70 family)